MGQWGGPFTSNFEPQTKGILVLNIDHEIKDGLLCRGSISFIDYDEQLYITACVYVEVKDNQLKGTIYDSLAFNPNTGALLPHFDFDSVKIIAGIISGESKNSKDILAGDAMLGEHKICEFKLSQPPTQNDGVPPDEIWSWDAYKEKVLGYDRDKGDFLYRGQSQSTWIMKTTFHRTDRCDLRLFDENNTVELSKYIGSEVGKHFDMTKMDDYGELLLLAQHHGYPTPLLDWTKSPFIAAFFAFNEANAFEEGYVRIFEFDWQEWHKDNPNIHLIIDPRPNITLLDLPATRNKRAILQQSIVMSSNVLNLDNWINMAQELNNKKYLSRIDISKSERKKAMKDLEKMGITSATLFPGVDGTCAFLKEKHYPKLEPTPS